MQPGQALVAGLIRAELSASETYRRALEKVGEDAGAGELRRIETEHRQAAEELARRVPDRVPEGSGFWGAWALAVQTAAQAFGDAAAALALREGEIVGIRGYERALDDPGLSADLRSLIESRLLPQARAHVAAVDDFLRLQRGAA